MSQFGYHLILSSFLVHVATSTVVFRAISFPDLPSKFAPPIRALGLCGALRVFDPVDACSSSLSRPRKPEGIGNTLNFALIERGECTFEEKIRNAQEGGFDAVIVYDNEADNHLINMVLNREAVKVPAVFVSKKAGEWLKSQGQGVEAQCCISPTYWDKGLVAVVASLIALGLVFSCFGLVVFAVDRWRNRSLCRGKVDAKVVASLPTYVFTRSPHSDEVEACAICLEDYRDGDVLRRLCCHHDFHSSCVDSWLINFGKVCPICKLIVRDDCPSSK